MKRSYVLGLGGLVLLLASCMAPPTGTGPMPSAPITGVAAPATSAAPAPSGSALAALSRLPIKGRAPKTGYYRDQFGQAWTDDNDSLWGHNGCDTRNDILRRDLHGRVTFGSCKVASGTLFDPYTGSDVRFNRGPRSSPEVQIDHVVALSNAWQTGAQAWSARERTNFANDPLELIATRGSVNETKGDGDAATWLPPNKAFRCAYAARMVAIKLTWRLWVTQPEHDALVRLLQPCGSIGLPTEPGGV